MNHNRFRGLNNFLDRLLEPIQELASRDQQVGRVTRLSIRRIIASRQNAAAVRA
jgi:hypothetical protein